MAEFVRSRVHRVQHDPGHTTCVTPWQTKGVLFQTEKKNKIGGEIQWRN